MTERRKYKEGDYLVVCDYTGFTKYASECVMTWDGRYVWKKVWEPRHPQDFVRSRGSDNQTVPIHRPRPADIENVAVGLELESGDELELMSGEDVVFHSFSNEVSPEDL